MKQFLPQEIVEHILLRLTPESLIRFKCVCKSWYALINDPSFVNKHLHISINNSNISSSITLFLRWTRQELPLDDIFSSLSHRNDPSKQVLSLVNLKEHGDSNTDHLCAIQEFELPPVPKIEQADFPAFLVSSHCNGIICLYDSYAFLKETIVLCNPTLKEFKLLRTPCLLPEFVFSACGFGYDSKANDYKYVKLFHHTWEFETSRAYVYSLRTDSWREINIDLQGEYCPGVDKGVYSKDVYYWWNCGETKIR